MTGRSLLLRVNRVAAPAIAGAQVEQNVHGDVAHFGEGFTAISERQVDFRLLRPANVVLFWVDARRRYRALFSRAQPRQRRCGAPEATRSAVSEIASPIQAPVINGAPVSGSRGTIRAGGEPADRGAPARRRQRRQRLLGSC